MLWKESNASSRERGFLAKYHNFILYAGKKSIQVCVISISYFRFMLLVVVLIVYPAEQLTVQPRAAVRGIIASKWSFVSGFAQFVYSFFPALSIAERAPWSEREWEVINIEMRKKKKGKQHVFFAVDFDLCTCLVRGLWKDGGNWPAENETRCELDIRDESALI